MNRIIKGLLVFSALCVSTAAQATTYNVFAVMGGSSGFGASSFHDASDTTPMTGDVVANIPTGANVSGSYNDATGALTISLSGVSVTADGTSLGVTLGGPTVTLAGTLIFASDVLANNSQLTADFNSPTGVLQDDEIGFLPGYVCCGSTNYDPNSFLSDGAGNMVMTLWGANFDGDTFTGDYTGSTFGMDLRLKMVALPDPPSAVPIPAAAWLFGSGLLALFGAARRRRR